MKFTLKTPDKNGNETIIIKKPIATPFQTLEDKVRIKLVYIPNNCYYWLIEDIVHKRKTSIHVNITLDPETLDESENVRDSSIYQLLRMYITNSLNELDIKNFKYKNELTPDASITEDTFYKHIGNIAEILHGYHENNIDELKHEIGEFKEIYKTGIEFIKNQEKGEIKEKIKNVFETRKGITKIYSDVATLLHEEKGIILMKHTRLIYKSNESKKGFKEIKYDDIKELMQEYTSENKVFDKDVNNVLSVIGNLLEPTYNIISFPNILLSMETQKELISCEPIFSLVQCKYNYNMDHDFTKTKIYKFLYSSLEQETPEKTRKYIKGVLQVIGHLFTSGNPEPVLLIIVGIEGSGKSTFAKIITEIFGKEKVSNVDVVDFDKPHHTEDFLGKLFNISTEADQIIINNSGLFKRVSGGDPVTINPKGKKVYNIPFEEVLKLILVCNNMPKFKNIDNAFLQRPIFIEFKHSFRDTKEENKDLFKEIISDQKEMESLIYESLKEHFNRINNNEPFILRKNIKGTRQTLNKHTEPLEYLINLLVKYDNGLREYDNEELIYTESLINSIIKLAEKEGLSLPLNNKGLIDSRKLSIAVKNVFDLWEYKDKEGNKYKAKYDNTERKRYYPDLCYYSDYEKYFKL